MVMRNKGVWSHFKAILEFEGRCAVDLGTKIKENLVNQISGISGISFQNINKIVTV